MARHFWQADYEITNNRQGLNKTKISTWRNSFKLFLVPHLIVPTSYCGLSDWVKNMVGVLQGCTVLSLLLVLSLLFNVYLESTGGNKEVTVCENPL